MKKIGIIGGLGPEATIDYYKRMVAFFHERNQGLSTPEIIIYSVDISKLFEFVDGGNWDALTTWLTDKLVALKNAGADFAAISANTPHIVFDRIQERSPLPLVSIVEATLEAAKRDGLQRLGLLGTRLTMQSNFFGERFAREGIEVVVPNGQEQEYVQRKLLDEIELGVFKDTTRQGLLSIIRRMKEEDNVDSVILGCTELPLILESSASDIPLLNTTAIHVAEICRKHIEDA